MRSDGQSPADPRHVRRARASDIGALVELRSEMFRAMGAAGVENRQWRDSARSWFAAHLDDDQVCIAVVVVSQQIVTSAMAAIRHGAPSPGSPDGKDILISNVCTRPDSRGQGHASAALAAVLQWARSTGVTRAELFATEDGRSMYEAAGFADVRYQAMRMTLPTVR